MTFALGVVIGSFAVGRGTGGRGRDPSDLVGLIHLERGSQRERVRVRVGA